MHILVTGAAGFIGSHLSERLASLGHTVKGLDCLTNYYSKELKLFNLNQLKKNSIEFLPLDLSEDNLKGAIEDIEFVYHLAAQPGISSSTKFDTYTRNNISATHQLLEAVKKSSRFCGLINVSSSSVYGVDATGDEATEPRPISYYGVTKLTAEQLILSYTRNQGLPACSMRLFSVYGPRERPEKLYSKLIECLLENKAFPMYEGSEYHLRSYTYVEDVIQGLISVLDNFDQCNGEIVNLGSDNAITTGEGIKIVEGIIGKSVKRITIPKRSGDQMRTIANIEKARRLLRYEPKTTPNEGLVKQVEWYKEHILGNINL